MAIEWSAVRVSKETKRELDELRKIWNQVGETAKVALGSDATRSGEESKRDQIGYDQVIRKLILYWRAHRERVKKSRS